MGKTKGTKIGLGAFLGESPAYTSQIPTGPRNHADGDSGGFQRSGRREQEPLKSDGVSQWRGAGGGGRSEGGFASRFNAQRQNETRQPMERPAHMRLNLQRKNESGSASRPTMINPSGDKFNRAFAKQTSVSKQPQEKEQQPQQPLKSSDTKKGKKGKKNQKTEEELVAEAKAAEAQAQAKKEAAEALALLEAQEAKVLTSIMACKGTGEELATEVLNLCAAAKCTPRPHVILEAVLTQKVATSKAKATPSWTLPESHGLMLAKLFQGTEAKTLQMLALYRVQAYCSTLDFPKGLIEKVFMNLYEHDIVDEEAFIAYKYDLSDDDETPGKMKAIIQLTNWLEWLEHAKEEEEDSDLDEEDEAEYMEQAPILL